MKTVLYQYLNSNDVYTLQEIEDHLIASTDCSPEFIILKLVSEELVENGGTLTRIKDAYLTWCNEYANLQNSSRHLSQAEQDDSIKLIYLALKNDPDSHILQSIQEELEQNNSEQSLLLQKKLYALLPNTTLSFTR